MIPHRGWVEDAAAFAILWFVLALILGLVLGPILGRVSREMPPPPDEP